jgi:hypothetical protein
MKADGIPTDHAIFIATKATADLHESAFHTCLARANKVQQEEQLASRVLIMTTEDNDGFHCPRPSAAVTHSPLAVYNVHHTPTSTTTFRSSSNDDDDNEEEEEES